MNIHLQKQLNNEIMNSPMVNKLKEKNKAYGVIMGILLVAPMIIGPVLIAIGFKLIGVLSMLIPWTIFIIVALNKRKSLINNFYKIKNARAKVNLVEANINTIRELYNNSALAIFSIQDNEYNNTIIEFLYNLLNNCGVLKTENLNVYTFNGNTLKQAFDFTRYEEGNIFITVFLKDLNINESNQAEFVNNARYFAIRWLDDVVDNEKN